MPRKTSAYPHVVRLADGTHYRVPPPGHPNQDNWCIGHMAARRFPDRAAAEAFIRTANLKGATPVPYRYLYLN